MLFFGVLICICYETCLDSCRHTANLCEGLAVFQNFIHICIALWVRTNVLCNKKLIFNQNTCPNSPIMFKSFIFTSQCLSRCLGGEEIVHLYSTSNVTTCYLAGFYCYSKDLVSETCCFHKYKVQPPHQILKHCLNWCCV